MENNNYIPPFTSIFKEELKNYLLYKRSCGYKYGQSRYNYLIKMDKFFNSIELKQKEINQGTIEMWQKYCKAKSKLMLCSYLAEISKFCEYLNIIEYKNIICLERHNTKYQSNFIPYIYNSDEIRKMFSKLKNNINIDKDYYTFYIMMCLYYCCGLRFSEAHRLKYYNYNSTEKYIIIENSKNNVTREIPLSETLNAEFIKYIDGNIYNNKSDFIFVGINNKHISITKVRKLFHQLLIESEIPIRYDGKSQRIHDLRHTFAVNSLKQMEEKGFDLYTSASVLSVYLGHKSITETEYYLRLVQEEAEKCQEKVKNYANGLYESKVIYSD